MLVYRIETSTGCGAFGAGLAVAHDQQVPGDLYRSSYDGPSATGESLQGYPAIKNALRDRPRAEWRFGAKSLGQLREWFFSPAGCTAMGKRGGLLVTYEVPDEHVAIGLQQLVFDRDHATKVSEVDAGCLHLEF